MRGCIGPDSGPCQWKNEKLISNVPHKKHNKGSWEHKIWKLETSDWKRGTGNSKRGTVNWKLGIGNCNLKLGTGSSKLGTGIGNLDTGKLNNKKHQNHSENNIKLVNIKREQ